MPVFWSYLLPPHDYPYYWFILDSMSKADKVKVTNIKNLPKFQIVEFWKKQYMRHTFLNCLITCAKWNGSGKYCWRYRADTILSTTDGQRDRWTDGWTSWNQYTPLPLCYKNIWWKYISKCLSMLRCLWSVCHQDIMKAIIELIVRVWNSCDSPNWALGDAYWEVDPN